MSEYDQRAKNELKGLIAARGLHEADTRTRESMIAALVEADGLCSFCGQDCGHRPLPDDAEAMADSLMVWAAQLGLDDVPESTFVRAAAILRGDQ